MVVVFYLDILNCPEGPEELPENVLLSFRSKIVDKDAPAGPVGGHPGQQSVARQQVAGQRREPKHSPGQSDRSGWREQEVQLSRIEIAL